MDFETEYENYHLHAFWSREITDLIEKMTNGLGKAYATQHDLVLHFINETLFGGAGEFNKEFCVKGGRYPDLKVPTDDPEKEFEIVELKLRTSQLKYLRAELKKRDTVFSTSDHLYFSYLLQLKSRHEDKPILERNCIYYLVIIKISKPTLSIPINKLISDIKMGTKHFTEELNEKSGVDEEKEELLGVDNIIKAVDLERKLSEKEYLLEEKEKQLEKKKRALEEERKLRREKEKEIERLKAQLKKKKD
ncbi:MAG: hypothetical protein R6U96_10810 [Promethearchaeia archaeon]